MRNHKKKRSPTDGPILRTGRKTQTTLRLPGPLYERAKRFVQQQKTGSVNDFIVSALAAYVRALDRKAIDDAFRGMAQDKQYQREALRIAEQFAASDAETIELSEQDMIGG